jgi:peptidyl-prolyl isomerase G (cyclophilin G)
MGKKLRTRCFFDVEIGGEPAGRVTIELFDDICPKTCENFRCLCTGEMGVGKMTQKPLHYKGAPFHRIVKNFMIQGGDFSTGNGRGGESIFGGTFADENFIKKHDQPYLLSMANRGPNTNGSQFFIISKPTPHLDGVHVVFGQVISGQEVIVAIENAPTDDKNSRPLRPVVVANCGELIPEIKAKEKKRRKSVSEEEDGELMKSKKSKKKHKKHKKHKKESKAAKEEVVEEKPKSDPDEILCSVKEGEVPEIGNLNFLLRKSPEAEKQVEAKEVRTGRRRPVVSRSGRIMKGRGNMRYRTPPRSRSRSRSTTPPHWRHAQKPRNERDDRRENFDDRDRRPARENRDRRDEDRLPRRDDRGVWDRRRTFDRDENFGRRDRDPSRDDRRNRQLTEPGGQDRKRSRSRDRRERGDIRTDMDKSDKMKLHGRDVEITALPILSESLPVLSKTIRGECETSKKRKDDASPSDLRHRIPKRKSLEKDETDEMKSIRTLNSRRSVSSDSKSSSSSSSSNSSGERRHR